jgi:hypothetical protein
MSDSTKVDMDLELRLYTIGEIYDLTWESRLQYRWSIALKRNETYTQKYISKAAAQEFVVGGLLQALVTGTKMNREFPRYGKLYNRIKKNEALYARVLSFYEEE